MWVLVYGFVPQSKFHGDALAHDPLWLRRLLFTLHQNKVQLDRLELPVLSYKFCSIKRYFIKWSRYLLIEKINF